MGQADIAYKELVSQVLCYGWRREDRTGVGTISLFSPRELRIDSVYNAFPLLTTKKINFNKVWHELMWFLRGQSSIHDLKAPKLWDSWADEYGQLGYIYGPTWRRWGGDVSDGDGGCGWGVDQIQDLIDRLKNNPFSRRHVVSAWNPLHNRERPEVPNACHTMFQCYVDDSHRDHVLLHLKLYMRSVDLAVGLPYNIASYAALMKILAQEVDMVPGQLVITFGDAHVYLSHLDKLKEQLQRCEFCSPGLYIDGAKTLSQLAKDDSVDDFSLFGYEHHPFIKYDLAV